MDAASCLVRGAETVYADAGFGGAVLMLHGWAANHRYWRKLWPRVVPRARALAPDLPGHGGSAVGPTTDVTISGYAEWTAAFLDRVGVDRAAVIGHSMGATVAIRLALRHPERVSRLVLLNPVVRGRDAIPSRLKLLVAPGVRQLLHALSGSLGIARWAGRDLTHTVVLEDEDYLSMSRADGAALGRSLLSLLDEDLTADAGGVAVPTLILTAREDRLVRPEQSLLLAAAMPLAEQEWMEGVGHCALLEEPEEFCRRVMRGLSEVPRPVRPPQW